MEQMKTMLLTYPWIIYVIVGFFCIGITALVVILIFWRLHRKKDAVIFEELPADVPVDIPSVPVISPLIDEDDYTRVLIEDEQPKLKSYRLALQELNEPGQLFAVLVKERIVIGRKQSCDIHIPNSTLSGEHCEIVLKNGKLYLCDLNSLNGTYLNGISKRISEELLVNGSIIEMGSERLQAIITVISS
ncbi:MAG: FHA domain-containing protein [Lachnospiraceae bacterium]